MVISQFVQCVHFLIEVSFDSFGSLMEFFESKINVAVLNDD